MFRFNNGYFIQKKVIVSYLILLLILFSIIFYNFIIINEQRTTSLNLKLYNDKRNNQRQSERLEQPELTEQPKLTKQRDNQRQIERPVQPARTKQSKTEPSVQPPINYAPPPSSRFDQIIKDPNVDLIRQYDYDKAFDPLTYPNKRVQRWELPRPELKKMIDIHTQGYPDTFRQIGILTSHDKNNTDNRVLRLYGRELYPRARRFEYYTEITSGNSVIKIPLTTRRGGDKELFDHDDIYIDELNSNYKVKIHDYSYPKYYPDLI